MINDDFVIHLEAAHIPRVAGILEAVLVALQEELEEEPARERDLSSNPRDISDKDPIQKSMGSH